MLLITFSKAGQEDIVLTEDDLFDFQYEASCYSGESFELGGVNAKTLYLLIDNNTQRFSRGTFANCRVTLEIDGKFFGYYNSELPKRRNGVIELTAYDDMVKLDTEFPTDYTFPQTFWAVYAQCVFEAGLAAEVAFDNVILNGVWDNGIISADYTQYIYANSCRNLVAGMAEWNGGFAYINDDNKLQIDKFSKTVTRKYNSGDLMELDYSDETVVFSKVKTSQKNKTYEKGTDTGYTLVLKNQYISYGLDDTMFKTYLTKISEYYTGFELTPMSFTLAEPDFDLRVGDRIQVYDEEEQVTITGNVSKIVISGNCSMTVTCGGFENVSSASNFTPTSYSQVQQSKQEVKAAAQIAGGTLNEYQYLTDTSVKFNGTTYTVEKDADTGLISKISDSMGNEFEPDISAGIAEVAMHNAVFWSVAMCRGLTPKEYVGIFSEYIPKGIDISNAVWRDNIGSHDMALVGSPTLSDGVIQLSGNQTYGQVSIDEPLTIYAYFKGIRGGMQWTPVVTKGLTSDTGGAAFDIWLSYGNIAGTGNQTDLVSNAYSTDWHAVCITREENNAQLYIDGSLIGNFSTKKDSLYAGFYRLNSAFRGSVYSGNPGQFTYRYVAFGALPHTADQVKRFTQDIIKKYGG